MNQSPPSLFSIWIDADACPKDVKEIIYKTSFRLKLKVTLVANSYLSVPNSPLIRSIQVDLGADVADSYIVENLESNDIVITADIPLASLVIEKGALALNPRGELYTEDNIGERLAVRDFMKELRDGGQISGGPPPFGTKDKANFANAFNKIVTQKMK
jgi:uncharacterized protein YaiI (UPF0178 family)